jgi:8-amino-7-oxononanoate synthase
LAALKLVRSGVGELARRRLADHAARAAHRLGAAGLRVRPPAGGVLWVGAPGPDAAVAWAGRCRDRGVAVGCFRPPSTPDGESALRLTINAGVPDDEFTSALDTIVAAAP